jgi:hypothetical protein
MKMTGWADGAPPSRRLARRRPAPPLGWAEVSLQESEAGLSESDHYQDSVESRHGMALDADLHRTPGRTLIIAV